MSDLTDERSVRAQYATEQNLETRRSVWQPAADGRDPVSEAALMVRESGAAVILEVGCGTGAFAERLVAENPGADVVACDLSARLCVLARQRGLAALQVDVQDLPFADASYDVVAALWMLYHVPDLGGALDEVRRVLRPGGLFVAATNGDEHLADLRRAAGGQPVVTQFSTQNGEVALRRAFDNVRRVDLRTRALFPDHAAAMAYLDSSHEDVAWSLPVFAGPREYPGQSTVFACR